MRLSIAGDFGYRERLFERSEFRDRRNPREAQGTPKGPHSWVAFLLVRFLWRSKENELAPWGETQQNLTTNSRFLIRPRMRLFKLPGQTEQGAFVAKLGGKQAANR